MQTLRETIQKEYREVIERRVFTGSLLTPWNHSLLSQLISIALLDVTLSCYGHLSDLFSLILFLNSIWTVTGTHANEEVRRSYFKVDLALAAVFICGPSWFLQTIDQLIETGNGDQIFAKAIQEQGRGQVLLLGFILLCSHLSWTLQILEEAWNELYFVFHLQVLDTLAEIQERHDAVRDIEKKLLELQQVLSLAEI